MHWFDFYALEGQLQSIKMNSFGKFLYGLYGVLILGSRIFKDMEEYDLKGSEVIRIGPNQH